MTNHLPGSKLERKRRRFFQRCRRLGFDLRDVGKGTHTLTVPPAYCLRSAGTALHFDNLLSAGEYMRDLVRNRNGITQHRDPLLTLRSRRALYLRALRDARACQQRGTANQAALAWERAQAAQHDYFRAKRDTLRPAVKRCQLVETLRTSDAIYLTDAVPWREYQLLHSDGDGDGTFALYRTDGTQHLASGPVECDRSLLAEAIAVTDAHVWRAGEQSRRGLPT